MAMVHTVVWGYAYCTGTFESGAHYATGWCSVGNNLSCSNYNRACGPDLNGDNEPDGICIRADYCINKETYSCDIFRGTTLTGCGYEVPSEQCADFSSCTYHCIPECEGKCGGVPDSCGDTCNATCPVPRVYA
jgi:hypothetical protein